MPRIAQLFFRFFFRAFYICIMAFDAQVVYIRERSTNIAVYII